MATNRSFPDTFIDEHPERAFEELNTALEEKSDNADWLCQRAYANILLKQYDRAVDDASKAQQLQPDLALAVLRRGIAEYHLNNFSTAHQVFTAGKELDCSSESFQTWIQRCEEKMTSHIENETTCNSHQTLHIKHDWYQTESQVVVTIMVKNALKDNVSVDFAAKKLTAVVKLLSGEDYSLNVNLLHPVVPEQSTYKILSTKIEIKMKKTEAIQWEKLEGEGTPSNVKHFTANQYPSSSHYTRNWDKVVVEINEEEKSEKLEGDAALNKLFQQIYSDGSDEVRRAMNKSFRKHPLEGARLRGHLQMESGGTVLSTNWTDVGKRKVEMNPPEDVEFKKY